MKKAQYPILEFDENKEAFINPDQVSGLIQGKVPCDKLVLSFFKEAIAQLIQNGDVEEYVTCPGENDYKLYKFKDSNTLLLHGCVGGPFCGGQLEEAIAFGVKKVMFCGGGGSLIKGVGVGELVVIDSAIRDEGLSYHYVPPAREIQADPKIVDFIKKSLDAIHAKYRVGKTWTTDALYRETRDLIEARKKEGAILVDMEQASLLSVAQFRGIDYGAILYAGDDMSSDVWDSRGWITRTGVRENLLWLCKEIVNKM
jgi:uridine phosphorylase